MPKTARLTKNKAIPTPEIIPQKTRKIAILGTAFTSVDEAPYDDMSWEIWNISANYNKPKRFTRWFEMHTFDTLYESKAIPEYYDFLKKCGNKLVAGFEDKEHWPDAEIYPQELIIHRFGKYFTSSCSYMVAMAIHEHLLAKEFGGEPISELGFWGVDMAVAEEYGHQRACLEYYIGIAYGLGMKVTIARQSPILRCMAMYALDNKVFSAEMTGRLLEAKRRADMSRVNSLNAEKQEFYDRGCRDTLQVLANYWCA